jgi:hypothetical protein
METHDDQRDTRKSSLKRLYDRLASIVRRLPAERREALEDYLDDQEQADNAPEGDDSRRTEEGD